MSVYSLRPYQQDAVKKLIWSQQLPGADICVLPTGAGKSLVIAELSHRTNAKILIVQPSKEILEQNYEKLSAYVPQNEIGIYSASIGRKDVSNYTFATIQSIYKKAHEFQDVDYIIIDECHTVNPKERNSMYMKFFRNIGNPKVVGLTATPYRLDTAFINLGNGSFRAETGTKLINRVKGNFWKRIVFCMNISELIEKDYLLPLNYIDLTILKHDQIPTNKSKSDFNLDRYYDMLEKEKQKVLEAVFFAESVSKHCLVFCVNVEQAEKLSKLVPGSAIVTARTKRKDREKLVQDFKSGRVKVMFNVGVFTTGFDFPELDCILLLRPTKSMALYYQMLGRGVRKAEGKPHCKVIDITGTVEFLGKVETIRLVKKSLWELESETGSWHNKPLYNIEISKQPTNTDLGVLWQL